MQAKRTFWALVALCSVGAYLFAVGVPASAHSEPQVDADWNPGAQQGDGGVAAHGPDAGGDAAEDEIVSDVDFGFGQDYPLKGVTGLVASYAEWYDCTQVGNPNAPGAACQLVGFDASPVTSAAPPGVAEFKTWFVSYNVTNNSETNNPRDIYFVGCAPDAKAAGTGPPYDTVHCSPDPDEQEVHVDSAGFTDGHAAGTPDTSGGRIQIIQEADGTTFTGPEQIHGAGLQNAQNIDVIAFTGPAGQHDALHLCIGRLGAVSPINAYPDGATPDGTGGGCTHNFTDLVPTTGGGTSCDDSAPSISGSDCWAFKGIDVLDLNNSFIFLIVEFNDGDAADPPSGAAETVGTGDCSGSFTVGAAGAGDDCVLDPVYVTTTPSGQPPGAVTPPPPPPPPPPRPGRRITTGLCDRNRPTANQDEILVGTNGPNQICGFGGRDTLRGRGGPDTLRGGPGKDVLAGGNGKDNLRGGGGADSMRGGRGADTLRGGGGNDVARGGRGNDLCRAETRRGCES